MRTHQPARLLLEHRERFARTSRGASALVRTPYTPAYDIYLGEVTAVGKRRATITFGRARTRRGDAPLSVLERRDGNILRVPERSRVMHRIPGGTPYHIEHLFGFWRTTAADSISSSAPRWTDGIYYTLVIATHRQNDDQARHRNGCLVLPQVQYGSDERCLRRRTLRLAGILGSRARTSSQLQRDSAHVREVRQRASVCVWV